MKALARDGTANARPAFAHFSLFVRAGSPNRSSRSESIAGEAWCRKRGLNPRPSVYKTAALPLSYSGYATEELSAPSFRDKITVNEIRLPQLRTTSPSRT